MIVRIRFRGSVSALTAAGNFVLLEAAGAPVCTMILRLFLTYSTV